MVREIINIVWLKRDLRTRDHEALAAAEEAGKPYVILYIFDPDVTAHADTSARHLRFVYQSLLAMNTTLPTKENAVQMMFGNTLSVFTWLFEKYQVEHLFSYRESGIQLTYDVDIQLQSLCVSNGVRWKEFQRDGILRGIKNRQNWDKKWFARMESPVIINHFTPDKIVHVQHPFPIPASLIKTWQEVNQQEQPPGEHHAWLYLRSFLQDRGKNYSKHISKPTESRLSCTRLSPYLAWGNLSIRQVYQALTRADKPPGQKRAVMNAVTRLKWHCHFIQKFETRCDYENRSINPAFEQVWNQPNESFLTAWENGQTGYPLVDASMRCVIQTGWINFRMRAMLVSFLCHHLFLDWRSGVYHLAQQFLDYEPGIHFTQFQMQAGCTGVNTIRVYNPVKNSLEHDPGAEFIKKWCPEIAHLPLEYIHQPWLMSEMEQEMYRCRLGKDYPKPVVSLHAFRDKRELLWSLRKTDVAREEGKKIVKTLVRPKP